MLAQRDSVRRSKPFFLIWQLRFFFKLRARASLHIPNFPLGHFYSCLSDPRAELHDVGDWRGHMAARLLSCSDGRSLAAAHACTRKVGPGSRTHEQQKVVNVPFFRVEWPATPTVLYVVTIGEFASGLRPRYAAWPIGSCWFVRLCCAKKACDGAARERHSDVTVHPRQTTGEERRGISFLSTSVASPASG